MLPRSVSAAAKCVRSARRRRRGLSRQQATGAFLQLLTWFPFLILGVELWRLWKSVKEFEFPMDGTRQASKKLELSVLRLFLRWENGTLLNLSVERYQDAVMVAKSRLVVRNLMDTSSSWRTAFHFPKKLVLVGMSTQWSLPWWRLINPQLYLHPGPHRAEAGVQQMIAASLILDQLLLERRVKARLSLSLPLTMRHWPCEV